MSQPVVSSQSLTNCLSKEGGEPPSRHDGAGQKREESGVSASSIQTTEPSSSRPNSNFVSATMTPRDGGVGGGFGVDRERQVAQARREVAPDRARHRLERDVLVVPRLGLRGGREDRLGEPRRLQEAGGKRNAADGAGLPVVLPAGAREVAAGDALERDDAALLHEDGAPGEEARVRRELGGEGGGVGLDEVVRHERARTSGTRRSRAG